MQINVTSNVDAALGGLARLSPQYDFAVALGLTRLARAGKEAALAELKRVTKGGPTPFTQRGIYSTRATKSQLESEVGIQPKQAEYLRYQVQGGARAPKHKALRVPGHSGNITLNAYGNLPAGTIRQLVARAKAGKGATKRQRSKLGLSALAQSIFYGQPDGWSAGGLFLRIGSGDDAQLKPLVLMPQTVAKYKPRYDFGGVVDKVVRAQATEAFRDAWRYALRTAG